MIIIRSKLAVNKEVKRLFCNYFENCPCFFIAYFYSSVAPCMDLIIHIKIGLRKTI